jgi:predicted RNA binding protein YcfA (HicA-like mRNA interferase family)
MGRLSGFRYREITRKLKAAGSHEIWFNPSTRRYLTIPNHSADLPEGTLRAIPKQAAIDPEEFLSL